VKNYTAVHFHYNIFKYIHTRSFVSPSSDHKLTLKVPPAIDIMSKYLHMSFRDLNSVKQKRIPWFTEDFLQLDDKGTLKPIILQLALQAGSGCGDNSCWKNFNPTRWSELTTSWHNCKPSPSRTGADPNSRQHYSNTIEDNLQP
jgi:hypothetical protein